MTASSYVDSSITADLRIVTSTDNDPSAWDRLFTWATKTATRAAGRLPEHLREDAIAEAAAVALTERLPHAMEARNPAAYLAQVIRMSVLDADGMSITVPTRVRRYYFAAIRDHGTYDLAILAARAGLLDVSAEVIAAAHFALTPTSVDAALHIEDPESDRAMDRADARQLVLQLLLLVTPRERSVVTTVFGVSDDTSDEARAVAGFASGEQLTDTQAGAILGLSRSVVLSNRHSALNTMRTALVDDLLLADSDLEGSN